MSPTFRDRLTTPPCYDRTHIGAHRLHGRSRKVGGKGAHLGWLAKRRQRCSTTTPAARGGHLPGGRLVEAMRIDMWEGVAQRSVARHGRGGGRWLTRGQVARRVAQAKTGTCRFYARHGQVLNGWFHTFHADIMLICRPVSMHSLHQGIETTYLQSNVAFQNFTQLGL